MNSKLLISFSTLVFLLGVTYQVFLSDLLALIRGSGMTYTNISDYPFTCQRLRSPLLESCETIVINHEDRRLYAACSSDSNRKGWGPGGNKFNTSARTLTDHVSILNLDEPGSDGLYGLHALSITGPYVSADKDKDIPSIDVLGFDIEVLSTSHLRFWMINHRPPIDAAGNFLDAAKFGANSTIEVFEHTHGSTELEHVKTIVSDAVYAPNSVVVLGNGGLLVTNDYDSKQPGFRRKLAPYLGAGSVAYCSLTTSSCHIASPANHRFYMANGITRSPLSPTTILVSSTMRGTVSVFSLSNSTQDKNLPAPQLHHEQDIKIGMFVDNLSVDKNGDVYVAAFPNVHQLLEAMDRDEEMDIGSTVWKLGKRDEGEGGEWVSEKVLEDIEGRVLHGSTSAVFDVKSGSYWLSGVASRFVVVCSPD